MSLVGACVQWAIFIIGNVFTLRLLEGEGAVAGYFDAAGDILSAQMMLPIIAPPDVGYWVLGTQAVGIGVATGWNFLANFFWTWGVSDSGST